MTADLFAAAPGVAEPTRSAAPGGAPIVAAFDLALATTGYARPDGTTGLIKTSPDQARPTRLIHIRDAVLAYQHADLVVVELLPKQVLHGGVEVGMVHGAVLTALHEAGTPVLAVPPSNLKQYATGKGNANKDDIRAELIKRLGLDIRQPDERDAWVLRAIGLALLGHPVAVMPKTHQAALTKLSLPDLRGVA